MPEVSSRVAEYLRHADVCEHVASETADPEIRATYLSLAGQWRHLARQREQLERGPFLPI
jgi:uncharacterized heparinase superfamily protein